MKKFEMIALVRDSVEKRRTLKNKNKGCRYGSFFDAKMKKIVNKFKLPKLLLTIKGYYGIIQMK